MFFSWWQRHYHTSCSSRRGSLVANCSFVFLMSLAGHVIILKMEWKVRILGGNTNSSGRFAVDSSALPHKLQAKRRSRDHWNQDRSRSARAPYLKFTARTES
jgi:hypothetical protein